ncbi:MAG: VCBS repeat-containing protein [Planctomycetes bacterium]|nr:VCBS repeat-containing protein [Planctomycetota bacterium]
MRASLILLATCLPAALPAQSEQHRIVEPEPGHLALFDIDGDAAIDLVQMDGAEMSWRNAAGELQRASLPGESSLWSVADADGDGRDELLVIADGDSLQRLVHDQDGLRWETLLPELGARNRIPRGHRPADLVRDINGDGRADLVVPLGDRVRLWFGSGAGFVAGPELRMSTSLDLQVGGGGGRRELLGRVSRTMRIPALRMRDLSGDGRPDLLLQDGPGIFQYVAGDDGLPMEPTAEVDLRRFEERLPALSFDAGNIAGLARQGVWEQWADLNLDGADDLIVLAGGTVIIYLGGEHGLDLRRPRDQLPTAGNVLYAFAALVDNDDLPDLVLLRVEDVSLARALTWVVFSFSVDFDLLAYEGLGNGRFSKRPMPQSKTLKVKSPSLLNLFKGRDAADDLRRTVVRLGDLDGDGLRTDLVVLDPDGRLRCWRDLVRDRRVLEEAGSRFLRDLLKRDKTLDLDADTLVGWLLGRASLLVQMAEARPPSFVRPAPAGWLLPQAMAIRDFDGDGAEEILVLRRRKPSEEDVSSRRLEGYIYDPGGD